MKEELELHGLVLSSQPVREFDKRLTLLTREAGKLTVWASGAKRPGSPLMAGTRSFVFGSFYLSPGKSGYNLRMVSVKEYFEAIALDLKNACYGSYLLELSEFISQEGLSASELVDLLYVSLRAVINPSLPDELVRRIFELRTLYINGEYTEEPPIPSSEACRYAWSYILGSPLQKLYTFNLKPDVLNELASNIDILLRDILPYNFKSLEVLRGIV